MVVNGEHGVGVGEFMEMDAYVRAGRGTCGPRGDGVVMISVRSRTRRARADAYDFEGGGGGGGTSSFFDFGDGDY